jgi:uncharacterized protein
MPVKEYKSLSFEVKQDDIKEDGTFSGYGSISDKNPDSYSDLIAKGAFKKTLLSGGRNGFSIPLLFNHDPSKIAGVWLSLAEDEKGLWVEGKLAIKNTLGKDLYELMLIGAKLGMSIGYDVVDSENDKKNNVRVIKELNLWEVSLVVFPAKTSAFVTNVKSIEDAQTVREIEDALRESGHTKTEAQHIINAVKMSLKETEEREKSLRESEIEKVGLWSIVDSLKEINQSGNKNTFSGILK